MDFWNSFEKFFGEKFPPCLIKLLLECGYSCSATIQEMSSEDINDIELYIEENLKHIVEDLECCHSDAYRNQKKFRFLPAHRKFVQSLKSRIKQMNSDAESTHQSSLDQFSPLLKIIIANARNNLNKIPTQCRYLEIIRYFSMYLYMVCGRFSYEILCSNLPLPQSSTVRKFFNKITSFFRYNEFRFMISDNSSLHKRKEAKGN